MSVVTVKNGPNKGKVFGISDSIITLGRDEKATIRILDQGVSRQHSEIFKLGDMCFIRDLGSTNGTFLNNSKIQEEMLCNGDQVTIGSTVLVFEEKATSTPTPAKASPSPEIQAPVHATGSGVEFESEENDFKTTTAEISLYKKSDAKMSAVGKEVASRNIKIIYEVSQLLTTEGELKNILHKIVEKALDAVAGDNGYVFFMDKKVNKAEPQVTIENDTTNKKVSRTIIKKVLETGKAISTSDATADSRFSLSESIVLQKIKSVLCVPLITNNVTEGVLYISAGKKYATFTEEDLELVASIGLEVGVLLANFKMRENLRNVMISTIKTLVNAIELANPKNAGHAKRVSDYSGAIATQMGLSKEEIHHIRLAALLHDIGKIAATHLPPDKADTEHVYAGEKLLATMDGFDKILPAIKYHHERADGSGFPYKIKNTDMPLMAKIIIVANALDNMCTSGGGDGRPIKEVIVDMEKRGGKEFDKAVVDAMLTAHKNGALFGA